MTVFLRKDASSYKSDQLGARSVMLRIPLPEYDGFALRVTAKREGSNPSLLTERIFLHLPRH